MESRVSQDEECLFGVGGGGGEVENRKERTIRRSPEKKGYLL